MRSRRALLYMPATDWRKIEKAASLNVDSICIDLEDGTALNRKEEGREMAVKAIETLDFGGREAMVRINSVGSGWEEADLQALAPAGPAAIVIPKVTSAEQVAWVSAQISALEPSGAGIPILAGVETALGIINLREIASADARLQALIFGAEDLAGDIGAVRTAAGWEVFYARSALVTHAAAFGLQAIDMLYTNYKDSQGLAEEAKRGAEMGYAGKQVIHPDQIAPTQAAFTPSEEEIEKARRIIAAYAENQAEGTGAFSVDGSMVDLPVVKAAEAVMARAKAAGKG